MRRGDETKGGIEVVASDGDVLDLARAASCLLHAKHRCPLAHICDIGAGQALGRASHLGGEPVGREPRVELQRAQVVLKYAGAWFRPSGQRTEKRTGHVRHDAADHVSDLLCVLAHPRRGGLQTSVFIEIVNDPPDSPARASKIRAWLDPRTGQWLCRRRQLRLQIDASVSTDGPSEPSRAGSP